MSRFFVLLFFVFLSFFTCQVEAMSVQEHKVNQVTGKVSKDLCKRFQMTGGGGGYLKIAFNMKKATTEEEARVIITECINYYVDQLNLDSDLIINNENCNFLIKDVEMAIYFYDSSGYDPFYPFVGTVSAFKGFVYYGYHHPKIQYPYSKTTLETYQEACQKARVPFEPDVTRDGEFQKLAKEVIRSAGAKVKGVKLEVEGVGFSGERFGVRYKLYQTKNHQEARALIIEAANALVKEINASEPLQEYLQVKPFTRDEIEVGIHFAEPTRRRGIEGCLYAPYVDSIALKKGAIDYIFYDNARHEHQETSETYETALSLLRGKSSVDKVACFVEGLD